MGWQVWAGIALLALLLGDVFFTVLHPQAHGGPVNRFLTRTTWHGFTLVGRIVKGAARDRLLSMGAPVLSAAVLMAWGGLLVTGFALIYASDPAALTHTQWVSTIGWAEAFYFSGIAATTLGMGDVLVEPGWFRALAVLEAFLGFMLISVSAAYILAIYSAQGNASSFALAVWGAIGDDRDEGVRRFLDDLDAADLWAGSTARSLVQITSDHAQYPILHYFRPPDHRQAMVPQVGTLLEIFRRLETRPGWQKGHPSLVMLYHATGRYLEEVSRRFVRRTGIDIEEGDDNEWSLRHRQALVHLGYVDEDEDEEDDDDS